MTAWCSCRWRPSATRKLVASTIRRSLGYKEEPGRPSIETIVDAIRDRELLLVLDNFEQVLPAAVAVARLLEGTSAVRVLVTSRAPLHLSGEQELPVPPLMLPERPRMPTRRRSWRRKRVPCS